MTKYFAAITGRDYITAPDGTKIPFWDMLDNQPGGWLTSIANVKKGIPNHSERIFDCGAWTYKDEEYPVLKGELVDAQYAYKRYTEHCHDGDLLISPDHMILPGKDNKKRMGINKRNAEDFIKICQPNYIPTVCIHGDTIERKLENLYEMKGLGYKSFALGGLAAIARKRNYCVSVVREVMENIDIDNDRVHVLGLSSFSFAKEWIALNVSSFDGASHYLKAMTAGYFYKENGGHHIAAKPGERIEIPRCNCRACRVAEENGGDTRSYGNSINNIGRAAHNLNIAIRIFNDYSTNDK